MSRRRPLLFRLWLSDWGLTALLVLLVLDGFVIGPLVLSQRAPRVLQPVAFSLILVSGIATTLRRRALTVVVGILVAAALAERWMSHVQPSLALARLETTTSLACCLLLAGLILVQVFRAGPINWHHIQGAIAVYLLLGFSWALAYKLVALSDPAAFAFVSAGVQEPPPSFSSQHLLVRLAYFSTITLTTVGYGDITPVSPVARSLAGLEAMAGQLFPAVLLARLVSMELYYRQKRGRPGEPGLPPG